MKIDLKELKNSLSLENIIKIVTELGADRYEEYGDHLVFPTICHNPIGTEASMKLYYYKDSHMFHCYTECSENFDIYELIKRVYEINKKEYSFYDIIISLTDLCGNNFFREKVNEKYISYVDDYDFEAKVELKNFNENVLDVFSNKLVVEWIDEGIGEKSRNKFGIKYYDYQNKVVIPHRDINGKLIGIRGRSLNPEDVERYGKYMPLKVENILYNHPLSFNLYGIYENKEDIKNYKTAIIFEGEKSVMLFEEYFNYNIAVASCGSSLNYHQIELLVKELQVENIILAYDKEYELFSSPEGEKYYDKLNSICKKYSNYCNFSFIFDFNNLLGLKDSPIDRGKEIFNQLLAKTVKVRN